MNNQEKHKELPEDRKVILMKIAKLYQRVHNWRSRNTGKASPSELNVAGHVLKELEEYTAAISMDHSYRLSQQDMRSINSYWKAYR
tara:strand:+ start:306 stop:563 length:258 start_codon:yes stop_codon:yes gene_type:complete